MKEHYSQCTVGNEVGAMFQNKKENMMGSVLTCQQITAGNLQLQPGEAVLFNIFDEGSKPDYQDVPIPIMESLDEHIIYKVYSLHAVWGGGEAKHPRVFTSWSSHLSAILTATRMAEKRRKRMVATELSNF